MTKILPVKLDELPRRPDAPQHRIARNTSGNSAHFFMIEPPVLRRHDICELRGGEEISE